MKDDYQTTFTIYKYLSFTILISAEVAHLRPSCPPVLDFWCLDGDIVAAIAQYLGEQTVLVSSTLPVIESISGT